MVREALGREPVHEGTPNVPLTGMWKARPRQRTFDDREGLPFRDGAMRRLIPAEHRPHAAKAIVSAEATATASGKRPQRSRHVAVPGQDNLGRAAAHGDMDHVRPHLELFPA